MEENTADKSAKKQSDTPEAAAVKHHAAKTKRVFNRLNFRILVIFAFVVAIGMAVFFGLKYRDTQDRLNNPTAAVQAETDEAVGKIGKLFILPSGETPTLFKITDITKRKEAFFKKAKNGDQGLIYTKAKLVILYRPSENKIVNAAPLNTNTNPNP